MRPILVLAIVLVGGLTTTPVQAQEVGTEPRTEAAAPRKPYLSRIDEAQAAALLAQLADAQRRLAQGETLTFALLSGSLASYEQADASPRATFLAMPFDKAWTIERHADSTNWQERYRLRVLATEPEPGALMWDIGILLVGDRLERVEMLYQPVPPF